MISEKLRKLNKVDIIVSDLEYESQFVFPNGFVDQNGIYYVNSKYYDF